MQISVKRTLATVGVLVTAGAASFLVAPSASASVSQCAGVVASNGYDVGPKVKAACAHGAIWQPFGGKLAHPSCLSGLKNIGVKESVARTACLRA
ncbi:hypothetical protein [Streptomyces sp. NPDC127036]|uniref:hypothetical protein n=1 Tax=Streptomyces sp. NPDC127036 TaxID=3347112 RepID=UPI00365EE84A